MVTRYHEAQVLPVDGTDYTIFPFDALGSDSSAATLPYCLKLLLENLLRHGDQDFVTDDDIAALANWDPAAIPSQEIAFVPARVLLQDFTGVPAIVDLAVMRDAMAARWAGGNTFMTNRGPNWTPTGQDGANQAADQYGIFARGRADNPFDGWAQVYFHYCTSDVYSGNALPSDNELGLYFRGSALAPAAIGELMDGNLTQAMPALADAEQVLIFGGSAGSLGAQRNMDRLADAIRAAQAAGSKSPATIKGFLDSSFIPPVGPGSFTGEVQPHQSYYSPVLDDDCVAAHSAEPELCHDTFHVVLGTGNAEGAQIDDGHLKSVEDVFVNMDQFDTPAVERFGPAAQCVRRECSGLDDCPAGTECFHGLCLRPKACVPEVCKALPCYGKSGPPSCFEEQGEHDGYCDTDDDCVTADGESCLGGFCALGAAGCDTLGCDEAAGYACGIDGVCFKAAERATECGAGYTFIQDLLQCREPVGCSQAAPCPDDLTHGYVCLPRRQSLLPQVMSYGIRQAIADPALGGGYSTRTGAHTAANGNRFFTTHFGTDNVAKVLARWYFETGGVVRRVRLPELLPLPLRAQDLEDIDLSGFPSFASFAAGCGGDATNAKAVVVCGAQQECKPLEGSALGAVRTTAAGAGGFVDGEALAAPGQRIVLKILDGSGACAGQMITIGQNEHVGLVYDGNQTVDVALPAGSRVGGTLWVSTSGATFLEPEFDTRAAGP